MFRHTFVTGLHQIWWDDEGSSVFRGQTPLEAKSPLRKLRARPAVDAFGSQLELKLDAAEDVEAGPVEEAERGFVSTDRTYRQPADPPRVSCRDDRLGELSADPFSSEAFGNDHGFELGPPVAANDQAGEADDGAPDLGDEDAVLSRLGEVRVEGHAGFEPPISGSS